MKRRLLAIALSLALSLGLCGASLAFDTSQDSRLMVLVNKTHTISADYVPQLQNLYGSVPVTASSVSMRPEAARAYLAMYQAMRADGVSVLYGCSGYRSYATQTYLVNSRVNAQVNAGASWQAAYNSVTVYTAPAGASEHQTGLAMDFGVGSGLGQSFADTPAGRWMAQHAWEYGFILRYEADKTQQTMIGAEAWHYRYVGAPHAKLMAEMDLCYEEYIDYLHTHGQLSTQIDDTCYDIFWTDDTSREFPAQHIVDLSSDNAGGWIITVSRPTDPFFYLQGHWSEGFFRDLQKLGLTFESAILPDAPVTGEDLARLCGLSSGGGSQALTREQAADFLAPYLPEQSLTRLVYRDLADIGGACFQGVQIAVSNGLFSHGAEQSFRPKAGLTWGEAAAVALHFRALGA